MISEEFGDYLLDTFQEIYDSIHWGKSSTPVDILKAHDELLEAWNQYFLKTDVWHNGYKVICESLGDCYFMIDTDVPEQNLIADKLYHLVKNSNDPKIQRIDKEFKIACKKEEINKDFIQSKYEKG